MNSGELYTIKRGASLNQPNQDNQSIAGNNHSANLHKTGLFEPGGLQVYLCT